MIQRIARQRRRRLALVVVGTLAGLSAAPAGAGKAAPAARPDPVDRLKNPADWLSWGADLRLRHEYLDNPYLLDADPPGAALSFQRYRARLWGTVKPADPLELTARLAWEGRYTYEPESREGWDASEVFWDSLNVKLTAPSVAGGKGPGQPTPLPCAVITAGRQDIIFGDGWLVLEGTPLDGSRSIYFDAVRAIVNIEDARTALDLVFIQQYAESDHFLQPFSDDDRPLAEQDERGVIVEVRNTTMAGTELDAYFIHKRNDRFLPNGDDGETYAVGGRAMAKWGDGRWSARLEGAYEFGTRDNPALFGRADQDLSAWGLDAKLTYAFKDAWNQRLVLGYEHLSGDDPESSTNEQFDRLWARWPQWSELYVYTVAPESRIAEISNLHRLHVDYLADPTKQLSLALAYHALFADENTLAGRPGFDGDGSFRGHLVTACAKYKFNRFATVSGLFEYLVPGDYYRDVPGGPLAERDDPAAYARVELVFTF